ncbi:MAG: lipoyl synthase [Myxococcales bacterium]|nr:lipoyl synthase [Myxococcales bacterium]
MNRFAPKPPWLKVRAPGGETYHEIKRTLRRLDLHTVCEEARCPNVGECWREGTATVMLLGDVCTRGCRFCAVTTGNPRGAVDGREPEHVARAVAAMGLSYVVMTMVNRDDLLDGGAEHVATTVRRLRELRADILIETLVGDFLGHLRSVDTVVDAAPDVFAHNVEVVRSQQRAIRDARCSYEQSLGVLRRAKERAPHAFTKSSLMVGVGETEEEVLASLADLRAAGVDIVTIGQYLRPTPRHASVMRYVTPEEFDGYRRAGEALGFAHVASGPLVRSSYKAAEAFVRGVLRAEGKDLEAAESVLANRAQLAREGAARVAGEVELLIPAGRLLRRTADASA